MEQITIENRNARVGMLSGVGGAVAFLEAKTSKGWVPVLRPSSALAVGPFDYASTVLAPFSNRISKGGFWFEGAFYAVNPAQPDHGLPIHGDALNRPWRVVKKQPDRALMTLDKGKIGPFEYAAKMEFQLGAACFRQHLTIINRGLRLPFGGGFHPFFQRFPDTTLAFDCKGVWLADQNRIPTDHKAIAECKEWDFRKARHLPQQLLDNGFSGWTGAAEIIQPAIGLVMNVVASENMQTAIVYAPDSEKSFFCFEPVLHPIDAVNLEGMPGMHVLDKGDSLDIWMEISWRPFVLP